MPLETPERAQHHPGPRCRAGCLGGFPHELLEGLHRIRCRQAERTQAGLDAGAMTSRIGVDPGAGCVEQHGLRQARPPCREVVEPLALRVERAAQGVDPLRREPRRLARVAGRVDRVFGKAGVAGAERRQDPARQRGTRVAPCRGIHRHGHDLGRGGGPGAGIGRTGQRRQPLRDLPDELRLAGAGGSEHAEDDRCLGLRMRRHLCEERCRFASVKPVGPRRVGRKNRQRFRRHDLQRPRFGGGWVGIGDGYGGRSHGCLLARTRPASGAIREGSRRPRLVAAT